MISICIATYNGEKFIHEQLESILNQISPSDEIIISDDKSTDKTLKIIESFSDKRIKVIHGGYKSPIYNFENALKHSKGEIIFLCDQDDIWKPNKFNLFINKLTDYDLVISDAEIIDEKSKIIHPSFFKLNNSKKGLLNNLFKNSYLGCSMAFKRDVLLRSLPFPNKLPMHDWWIGLVAELFFKTYFINEKLLLYRRHQNNVSNSGEKSTNSLFTKIKFRLYLIKELIKKY